LFLIGELSSKESTIADLPFWNLHRRTAVVHSLFLP